MAVRMLESRSDANIAVAIAVHEKELNLANRTVEYIRCGRVANRRVSINNSAVVRRIRFVLINLAENGRLQ